MYATSVKDYEALFHQKINERKEFKCDSKKKKENDNKTFRSKFNEAVISKREKKKYKEKYLS